MKHLRLIYFNAPEECEISPLEVHVSVGRVLQGAKTVFRWVLLPRRSASHLLLPLKQHNGKHWKFFGRNMYNQNNANYSLVSKCDTTGRPEHADGLTWISLAHLRSFTSLQMQLKYNAASFFRASRLHHISRHRLRLIEMENAWSNSSNSSQNSFQYFMFCMHVWQFSRNAKPGYQDFATGWGAGRGKGKQGRGQWRAQSQ